jgi:putative nucleotidyltransferase with HDIG domain
MTTRTSHAPRSFELLSMVLVLGALALLGVSWGAHPFTITVQLALVVAGAFVGELFSFEVAGVTVSLAYPLVICALVLGGPSAAAIAAASTAFTVEEFRRNRPVSVVAFNFGQLVVSSCLGGWTYLALGARVLQSPAGSVTSLTPADFPAALYGIVGAALVYGAMNVGLVSVGFGMYRQAEPWAVAKEALPVMLPSHAVLPLVGLVMAQVLAIQVWALPLFVFPLFVARQLYQRYLELRRAYADTVRSLVGALEAKDPYTRGHSERVSAYAARLGDAMGFDRRALERLEYAALLHDLGKLAVPSGVLAKPARLKPQEMNRIQEHPTHGANMVQGIPHLRDLADTVRQHHERIDGTGYPAGVGGAAVSVAARVLAVADCYDAMTTNRAYRSALTREQALNELIAGSGSQFDAEVVMRFIEHGVGVEASSSESQAAALSGSDCRHGGG